MKRDASLSVHWFWQSKEEFFDELSSQLTHPVDKSTELYIRGKVVAFLSGRARNRKDFKELVGHKEQGLFEIRFTLPSDSPELRVRLILSKSRDRLIFLLWHVKDSTQSLEEQRANQNLDCLEAIERLKGMNFDNPHNPR